MTQNRLSDDNISRSIQLDDRLVTLGVIAKIKVGSRNACMPDLNFPPKGCG